VFFVFLIFVSLFFEFLVLPKKTENHRAKNYLAQYAHESKKNSVFSMKSGVKCQKPLIFWIYL